MVLSRQPPRPGSGDPPGWQPVRKTRRISRFPLSSGPAAASGPGPGQQPRCEVELTEIRTRGQDWWTLGFETTGPAELLRSELQATAALVFAHALPGGMQPGPDQSRSYAEWLSAAGRRKSRLKAGPLPGRLARRPAACPTGDARGHMTAADHIEVVRPTLPAHGRRHAEP